MFNFKFTPPYLGLPEVTIQEQRSVGEDCARLKVSFVFTWISTLSSSSLFGVETFVCAQPHCERDMTSGPRCVEYVSKASCSTIPQTSASVIT